MSDVPDILRTYQTTLHGQVVTVTRYAYVPPKTKHRTYPTRGLIRAAENIWEETAHTVAVDAQRNETDYAKIRTLEPIAELTDWDAVGSNFNPEKGRK